MIQQCKFCGMTHDVGRGEATEDGRILLECPLIPPDRVELWGPDPAKNGGVDNDLEWPDIIE